MADAICVEIIFKTVSTPRILERAITLISRSFVCETPVKRKGDFMNRKSRSSRGLKGSCFEFIFHLCKSCGLRFFAFRRMYVALLTDSAFKLISSFLIPLSSTESLQSTVNTGGDNSNKGCLGSPMNNFLSSRKFGRPSRIFWWHSPCLIFNQLPKIVSTILIRVFLQRLVNYATC